MPHIGAELGVDLYDLYTLANADLLALADRYRQAAGLVTGVDPGPLFQRAAELDGPRGESYRPWAELHDRVATFLGDTADNVEDTARALLRAVDEYAATDAAAATELHRLIGDKPGE